MQYALTQFQLTPKLSELSNGIAADIIKNIDYIHGFLMKAGFPTRSYTSKGIEALLALDESQKRNVLQSLQNWRAILVSSEADLGNIDERYLAERALKHFNFRLKDHDWTDITKSDELIEIYTPQGIQLYRSLNFFETCGYSLLDLCVHEWFVLWERPKFVIDELHRVVGQLLNGTKHDNVLNIGPHLIRETYDDGTTQPFSPRTAVVEFRNVYPVFSANKDELIAFIVTSKGRLISVGDDVLKMGFI